MSRERGVRLVKMKTGREWEIRDPPPLHNILNQRNTTLKSCEIHSLFWQKTKVNLGHMSMKQILQIDFD